MLKHIFELAPVALAVGVIILLSIKFGDRKSLRRNWDRTQLVLQITSAFMLIIAQLSWYTASVVNGKLEDTWFADNIWTIFNIMVMICFFLNGIALSHHRPQK